MDFCKFMDSCMYDHKKIDQNRSLLAKTIGAVKEIAEHIEAETNRNNRKYR